MKNARKYILNLSDVMSCGIGSEHNNSIQYNMLDEFNITYNTTPPISHTYPEITTEDLKFLSVLEYEKRVIDYIDVMEIDDTYEKEFLFNSAVVEEEDCTFYCQLNPNFLVYKFLSGIRVVNIGKVNGIAQYRVYPSSANPDDYSWKTNPSFLNLDQNGTYNVEIRDYFENDDICKFVKLVSMPLLIPSTTINIQNKLIGLNEISSNETNTYSYKNGCIEITDPLTINEKVSIDYVANITAIGEGEASVHFTCQPNGTIGFENHTYISNLTPNSPRTGSIDMCYGDIVCYNVMVQDASYGSNLEANFCLTSVNGLGTTYPSIDVANCSVSVSKSIIPLQTEVSFDYVTGCSTTVHNTIGVMAFSNPIPDGQCVTIDLIGTNMRENDASSYTVIKCKPDGGSQYLSYYEFDGDSVQPQTPTLVVCGGDSVCYDVTVLLYSEESPVTSTADVSLCIENVGGSFGVNPMITTVTSGHTITDSISSFTPDIILSVCRNTNEGIVPSNGYINLTPPLTSSAQNINTHFEVCQVVCGLDNNETYFRIYRKSPDNSLFELFNAGVNSGDEDISTGSFSMEYGYIYCYINSVDNVGEYACSEFRVTSVGSSTNNPQIDTQIGKDRDVLTEGME